MKLSFQELEIQARKLSAEERARLAECLLESLQEPAIAEVSVVWNAEIEHRVDAWKQGNTTLSPASDIFAEARKRCR